MTDFVLPPDHPANTIFYRMITYLYEAGYSSGSNSSLDSIEVTYHFKDVKLSADVNKETIDILSQTRAGLEAVHQLKPTRKNWSASFTGLLFVTRMNGTKLDFDYKDPDYPEANKFSKAQRDAITQLFAECGTPAG